MARNDQLTRTLRVLRYLELNPRGLTVREILNKLQEDKIDTSRDSVYRDLKGLNSGGFPIIKEGENDESKWKLDPHVKLDRGVVFSYSELIALYLARETLKSLEHSPIYESIEGFFHKLEEHFGPRAHEGLKNLRQSLKIDPAPNWLGQVSREVMDTVHDAVCEGHYLQIDYRSVSGANAGKVQTRKVGAIKLWFANAGAYLFGFDPEANMYKKFALSRISRAVMLDEIHSDHNVNDEEYFAHGIGVFSEGEPEEVEIFIEEPIASYIAERVIHKTQRIVRKENGILLTMNVRVNDELARWVLGLGEKAEVLKPNKLNEKINTIALAILRKKVA